MSERLLEIENLEVVYETDKETVHAVNGISFHIDRGETIGIVGETGAGKTTTALSILRLLPERTGKITNGSIKYMGENILEMSNDEMISIRGNKIAMVFQDPMTSLNPVISIGNQIGEVVSIHNPTWSKAQIEARVEEVLELVGILPSRKNEYPHQFSGGMKQRVVIAIALAANPQILIADEATTALDVTIQAQVLLLMQDLIERLGTALLLITHDLGIVAKMCDRVAVMYAGEFIEFGDAKDIFTSDKHHPYTVGLFNSIPNLRVKTERLSPIPGLMPDPTKLPEGCNFSPRCPYRTDICEKVAPKAIEVAPGHEIACHLFNEQ